MNVVLYLRYSSERQNEQSIEGQQRVCKEFCDRNDMTIVDVYVDRALSAAKNTEKRKAFQQMIKDSEKHLWEGVVVYKLDRFARKREDSALYKARLRKNGVKVISATEGISDAPESIILESVLEGLAEYYSKELAQKITRGMRETALKGNSCGGQLSLGYKIVDKKLVIDPLTAPYVKQAFEMYANGKTVAEICRVFNAAGIKTKKGGEFNKNSFRRIFGNKKYIGMYKYTDIKIEGGVPAIVDKETFDKVQKRLQENAKAPARGKAIVDYMLSGKIYCGHCESLMLGCASTSHTGRKYFYYACGNRRRNGGCKKENIRKEVIEKAVVADAMELLTKDYIEQLADMAIKANQEEIKFNSHIPALEEEIAEITKSINNLIKLAESGTISDTLSSRITELEKQKKATERRLLKEKSEVITLDRNQIIYWLEGFLKGDIEDPEFQRSIIDLLVKSVHVWDNPTEPDTIDVFITYNLTPKQTKKFKLNTVPPNITSECVFDVQKSTKMRREANGLPFSFCALDGANCLSSLRRSRRHERMRA